MKAPAHLALGVGLYVTVQVAQRGPTSLEALLVGTSLVALGALLPDADHPGSAIARVLGPVSQAACWLLSRLTGGHRGFLHSLWPVLLLWWLVWPLPEGYWLAVGYASHLAADALTPAGVRLLWPWPWPWRVPRLPA